MIPKMPTTARKPTIPTNFHAGSSPRASIRADHALARCAFARCAFARCAFVRCVLAVGLALGVAGFAPVSPFASSVRADTPEAESRYTIVEQSKDS